MILYSNSTLVEVTYLNLSVCVAWFLGMKSSDMSFLILWPSYPFRTQPSILWKMIITNFRWSGKHILGRVLKLSHCQHRPQVLKPAGRTLKRSSSSLYRYHVFRAAHTIITPANTARFDMASDKALPTMGFWKIERALGGIIIICVGYDWRREYHFNEKPLSTIVILS